MEKIKLYNYSAYEVLDCPILNGRAEEHGYKKSDVLKAYTFLLSLKALYQYSYISSFSKQKQYIASKLGISAKTVSRRIELTEDLGFTQIEGTTLRLYSYKAIRTRYGKRIRRSHRYEEISLRDAAIKIKLSLISRNIDKQKQAIKEKIKKEATILASCKFERLIHFGDKTKVNLDISLSQLSVSKLLGFKSKSSGFNFLRSLRERGMIEIKSNMTEISRAQYNIRKKDQAVFNRLLIKGKKDDARFFVCLPNSIKIL